MRRTRAASLQIFVVASALASCAPDEGYVHGFRIRYTVSLASGVKLDGAEAVTVIFMRNERITDSFPPQAGNIWFQEPLSLIDSGLESSQNPANLSYRHTRWRGYARLVPPRGDEPAIVGDIVEPVFDEDYCEDDVCYLARAHFVLGRVTVP